MDDDEDRATDHCEERREQGSCADRQGHQSPRFFAARSAHDSVRRCGSSKRHRKANDCTDSAARPKLVARACGPDDETVIMRTTGARTGAVSALAGNWAAVVGNCPARALMNVIRRLGSLVLMS